MCCAPAGAALLVANGVADKEEILALWREAADAVDPSFAWPVAPRRFSVDVDADLGLVEPAFPDLAVDMLTGRFHVDSPEPVLAWLGEPPVGHRGGDRRRRVGGRPRGNGHAACGGTSTATVRSW